MKQLIFIMIAGLFFYSGRLQAQSMKLGSRFTIGQSEFKGKDFDGKRPGLLLGIGGSADYSFNKWFGLMGDVMFMSKAVKQKGSVPGGIFGDPDRYTYTEKYQFFQAEIPLMAKLRIGNEKFALRAFAGPVFGFNLMSVHSRIYDDESYNNSNGYSNRNMNDMNIFENGLVYGIGIEITGKQNELYFGDIRSGNSLSPLGKFENRNIYLSYFNLSFGALF